MNLPDEVRQDLAAAGCAPIQAVQAVGGGCISSTARVATGRGIVFVKWGDAALFDAEVAGLEALRASGTVRTPAVIARGQRSLVLEWLPPAPASAAEWRALGEQLANLHRVRGAQFGWPSANFIGSLPQPNAGRSSWPVFWREQRLGVQLQRARASLAPRDLTEFERLFEALDDLLAIGDAEGASLLHGDLWSGNVHAWQGGIALIDPASYYGHREVDLAMAALFGGFPPAFWQGYEGAWPLEHTGFEQRRAIYQLYYLLVHVNLFGSGYVGQTRAVLRRALSA